MTRLRFVVVIVVLVSVGTVYVLFRPATATTPKETARTVPPVQPPSPPTLSDQPDSATTPLPPVQRKHGPLRIAKGQPIPEAFPHQAERQSIQQMADTYEAKNIPAIAVYLAHTDDTVRTAARMALVQIGDAAAVPYLEAALQPVRSEEETEALKEAISFLKLPPMLVPPAPADTAKAP